MKSYYFIIGLFSLLSICCKRNANKDNSEVNKNDTIQFFQIKQYLQGQIKEVNDVPYFIYRIDNINNKADSSAINTAIFNQIAHQFLAPDINDSKIKKYYTENIFEDQTTKGFTISYSTTNKELELQNADILLSEDGQTVKRIFIRKFHNYPDSSAIEQLSWKPGESFQINRSVQKASGAETLYQTRVVWNSKS